MKLFGLGPGEWVLVVVGLYVYAAAYVWLQAFIGWRCHLGVVAVGMGFGPGLFRRHWGMTEVILGSIPLGGYTRFAGKDDGIDIGWTGRRFQELGFFEALVLLTAGPLSNLLIGFLLYTLAIDRWLYVLSVWGIGMGAINLLPLPLLNGGHIVFNLIAAVRGRPVSDNFRTVLTLIALPIVIGLIIWFIYTVVTSPERLIPTPSWME